MPLGGDVWLDLAQDAGMEYVCLTVKHCDGFCLWDTRQTDFKVTCTPFGQDVLALLAEACRRRGFPLCLYYSVPDMHCPHYPHTGRNYEYPQRLVHPFSTGDFRDGVRAVRDFPPAAPCRHPEHRPSAARRACNPAVVFQTPPQVTACMGALERFLNDQPEPTSPLLKAALAHVQFETIHPFLDGNGRLGRLLITLILCERQVLRDPMLYLSLFFKTHRQAYYELLNRARIDGDWEAWLDYFAEAVTVNKTLDHLCRLGLTREITGHTRNRVFSYPAYLAILNEGTEPLGETP